MDDVVTSDDVVPKWKPHECFDSTSKLRPRHAQSVVNVQVGRSFEASTLCNNDFTTPNKFTAFYGRSSITRTEPYGAPYAYVTSERG